MGCALTPPFLVGVCGGCFSCGFYLNPANLGSGSWRGFRYGLGLNCTFSGWGLWRVCWGRAFALASPFKVGDFGKCVWARLFALTPRILAGALGVFLWVPTPLHSWTGPVAGFGEAARCHCWRRAMWVLFRAIPCSVLLLALVPMSYRLKLCTRSLCINALHSRTQAAHPISAPQYFIIRKGGHTPVVKCFGSQS